MQLGKLTLGPFTGDITKFHRFWSAFELAGEAQVVLQDLDPDECNYHELVAALKSRYDRPYKTRATLHRQLQQLPVARNNGQDLRSTWFRVSGILHGLRRYEDFRTVLPILDLSPVRDRSSHHTRRASPYPRRYQTSGSDAEADIVQ
ncbi:hypothetical protein TELCIR_04548 [Teladorsagia circumcincta]|uniref:Uncharacterized protein n=1 Tax=Teladorsagia circumcincta TaxID=45464 RepID=A0A2G9UT98_TELCI|nr:hypothetical protein TELCIR_04548 [Teladorsagia circumcincta]